MSKKPFVPSQLGMRFAARKKQHVVKITRSHSPAPARTPNNYCDEYRRLWAPSVYTKQRSRFVQPKECHIQSQLLIIDSIIGWKT